MAPDSPPPDQPGSPDLPPPPPVRPPSAPGQPAPPRASEPPAYYPPPPPPGQPPPTGQPPAHYPPPPPPGQPPPAAGSPPWPPPQPGPPSPAYPAPQPGWPQPAGASAPPPWWPAPPPGSTPAFRLRPLSFGELLDEIFRIYRRHFWLLVSLTLMLSLPTLVLQIISGQADQLGLSAALINGATSAETAESSPPQLNFVALGVEYLVVVILAPFIEGAVMQATIDAVLGTPVSLASCLLGVLRRYWALLGVALLYLVLTPTLLCFPVFIWIGVRWSVAVPVLLAERQGPVRAIQRSWELTRGNWWRIFGILAVVVLIEWVMNSVLSVAALPIAIAVPFVSTLVRGAIALTVTTLATSVVTPIIYLCIVLLYFDLRIRKESFDLDQLAAQVRASGGP